MDIEVLKSIHRNPERKRKRSKVNYEMQVVMAMLRSIYMTRCVLDFLHSFFSLSEFSSSSAFLCVALHGQS